MTKVSPPPVGTIIHCPGEATPFTFRGSNTPVLRLQQKDGGWVFATDPLQGFLVFVTKPSRIVFKKVKALRLYNVTDTYAKAEVVDE